MDKLNPLDEQELEAADQATEIGTRFLQALFHETDRVVFRPIETWVEAKKKRSRVIYKSVQYPLAEPNSLNPAQRNLRKVAERDRANIFFGVCPRLGDHGRFDLAWQIRTIRTLWADIDHVTVDEGCQQVIKAGLPQPSIIVNSGNGVHLYWLLDTPYLIDDVGDPPPVETEWTKTTSGRSKPRKYFLENGEKVYLDQRRRVSRLSPKAERFQGLLAGIAKACGGDHTTDLSRLLRLPGTLNRKDQRSGHEPMPTSLVRCEPSKRYLIAAFETFASQTPEAEQDAKIATMPLPRPRKISPSKADKLAELIATCSVAPSGSRSEVDFAMCCYAIRNGISQDEIWRQVEQVGKFAEQGRHYFDHTWGNAEYEVRATTLGKLEKQTAPKGEQTPTPSSESNTENTGDPSSDENAVGSGSRPIIVVEPQIMPVGDTLRQVTDCLLLTGQCFSRTNQLVVVHDDAIESILSSPELAGLLNQHVEFFFVDDRSSQYKPLQPAYGNTWLNHRVERSRLPAIKLFTRNPVYTNDWRLVAPGFDPQSGAYYAGPAVKVRNSTVHLDALLQDFCFKSPADRTNFIGVLLTAILIPRFIGSKPAALFNGNQPGLGKSILAQIIAILRDGHAAETATYNANDEEFEKRLGAIVRRGVTTIIIDNAKGRGKNPKIESACLERSITDPILSFRLLGHSQEIRMENSHIFCITANAPDVSRDLVTRSVIVNLYHEGDPVRRSFSIVDPEEYAQRHRLELLGELMGMVERWKASGMPMANVHSRFNKRGWGLIVGGILLACDEPDFLANADQAAAQLDETRRDFAELVNLLMDHPQGIWTASELVELCGKHRLLANDLGEGSARSLATKMGTLAGRFLAEPFPLSDGRQVVFHRSSDRKGNTYRVGVDEKVPNLGDFAEPLPNLVEPAGSAP